MIKKIKNKFKSEDNKRLLSNFLSLSVLQGANFLIPLITFPYLVRVLGVENYGLLAFCTAIIAYIGIFVDYGFSLTATRAISVNRGNAEKVIEIYSAVIFLKFVLMLLGLLFLVLLVLTFDKLEKNWEIYFLTYGLVVGHVFFPVWFFQGMEKMKYITFINLGTKILFTIAIFIFITKKDDLYLVPLLNSMGVMFGSIYSLYFIKKEFMISYKQQNINILKKYLNEGKHIFYANLSGNLYGQGNIIILSFFSTELIVGYYSIAQKLASVVTKFFQVIQKTIFPYVAKRRVENMNSFKSILYKIIIFTFFVSIVILSILFALNNDIYYLISGIHNENAVEMFDFWLLISFFTIINVMFHPFLIAMNQDKYLAKVYIFVGISFLIYSPISTYIFNVKGMLYSMLIVEIIIFISSLLYAKKGLLYYEK